MAESFDVVVIGAGPGGYTAAIRAAQLGFRVACIDDWKTAEGKPAPGGTCTNVGCIPSKALLQSSENYEHAGHAFAEHGIEVKGLALNLGQMLARKDKVVGQNNDGIVYLFKKNKIAFFNGTGSFAAADGSAGWRIAVSGAADQTLTAKHVIIATGSKPRALPGAPFDNRFILDNEGALALSAVPKTLGVIGAGVIGLEMGSVWRRLGAEVTVLEALPVFLGAADEQVAKEAWKLFAKQGLSIRLGCTISKITVSQNVAVDYTDAEGKAETATFDRLIVSIGRVPHTAGLNGQSVGLTLDERGFVAVDDQCRTNLANVWAIGDVVRGPMLAHKAEEEAVAVAERIAGQHGHVDFNTVPWVIYTSPEIAWVGQNEQQLKAAGIAYRAGMFPFMANGRARALGDTRGFVKLLADAKTDRVLGMHAIGPMVSELIAEGVVAMEFGAASEDIARICHAHPSLSEVTREAALAVDKRALNY
ncbi:MAG TPA: dihydrolipoyl dehydrogenase [Casimicrobiaceae bacterium]|nr:dihydrolipoyl dehydrogenase [Casimicrobiaceae bacterium]